MWYSLEVFHCFEYCYQRIPRICTMVVFDQNENHHANFCAQVEWLDSNFKTLRIAVRLIDSSKRLSDKTQT